MATDKKIVRQALSSACAELEKAGADSPRLCAEALLARCLGIGHAKLFLASQRVLTHEELLVFGALVRRRCDREPLAYILGEKEFYSRTFSVDRNVLIPRQETEHLVEAALSALDTRTQAAPVQVLELGVGSGAIIVTLACERPGNLYFATDSSRAALEVARRNADALCPGVVRFLAGDWFAPLAAGPRFDLIVTNPPYIKRDDIPGLQKEVSGFEPAGALDGGPDGLAAIQRIIGEAPAYLAPAGALLLEMGMGQADEVERIAARSGVYRNIAFFDDYAGIARVARLDLSY
ncbi:MAG: peptide chain release factor N(5)-glutamine methyltransferase [Thermodesulfobacteriota bacterium]